MKRATNGVRLQFTALGLENWRNFAAADVLLQQRVFLVGPNASGKSNFLDALRFLHDIVSVGGGFEEAVRRRGGVSSIRCLAARRHPEIKISIELGTEEEPRMWRYVLSFNQDNLKRPIIRQEVVVRGEHEILRRPDERDEADHERLTQTYLEQKNTNQHFREIADFFGSLQYLHIIPQLIREPDRSVGKTNDPYGGDFLEQIAKSPERTRNARLRRITEALKAAVPQLQDLELKRDDVRGTPHLRGTYEHWRPQGAWQTEEQFSDGTLRLMGLLWITLAGHGPLLLEEPELSLHPEVVRHIPQMFARVQRRSGRQVLISTHSQELLSGEGIGVNEVLLLEPGREGTAVRGAHEIKDVRALLDGGVPMGAIVMPRTRPAGVEQLMLFEE